MQIHYQLATLKKGNSSIADYFHQFTTLVDTLAATALIPCKDNSYLIWFFKTQSNMIWDLSFIELYNYTNSNTKAVQNINNSTLSYLIISQSNTLLQFKSRTELSHYSCYAVLVSIWIYTATYSRQHGTIIWGVNLILKWQKYVEWYFNTTIKIVQSNWGGEYCSLHNFLQNYGITHRVSCLHTHQQNGVVERKHRHVEEIGLALLYHAKVPLQYWDDVFQTTCYLIDRLPTSILKNQSPFEKLFHQAPNYNFLRVFRCSCWPNLRSYNSHKLQPRSIQCVFSWLLFVSQEL